MKRSKLLGETQYFLLALVVIATTLRVVPMLSTYGTEDINTWARAADALARSENPYVTANLLWPPMWPLIILAVKSISVVTGLEFATWIKLPPVLADVAIALVIYYYFANRYHNERRARRFALIYAVNPVSILVTAVHGQFDSFPTLFLLLSAYFADDEQADQTDMALAALFFGLAIFAKGWPLLLLPLLAARARGLKQILVCVAIALFPYIFSMSALYLTAPSVMFRRVLFYSGQTGWWGVTSFAAVWAGSTLAALSAAYSRIGNYVLIIGEVALAVYYSRRSAVKSIPFVTALLAGLVFFYTFTAGYGIQYWIWIVPFVLIDAATNRYARFYFVLLSSTLLIIYLFRPYSCGIGEWVLQRPDLRSACFSSLYGKQIDITVTNILSWPLWIASGLYLINVLRRWRQTEPKRDVPL
jgi:Gpi18-like mannosyltransferase